MLPKKYFNTYHAYNTELCILDHTYKFHFFVFVLFWCQNQKRNLSEVFIYTCIRMYNVPSNEMRYFLYLYIFMQIHTVADP